MPLLDAYVTDEEFSDATRSGRDWPDGDPISADLLAMTRLLDREMGFVPGAMNEYQGGYTVDGIGNNRLWLRDGSHLAFFLQSVDEGGIGVDTERDGTYDGLTFDLSTPWVRLLPGSPADTGEGGTSLELLPLTGALLHRWPDARASVRITGDFGWPGGPPDAIKNAVISMTRDLRDHRSGGSAGVVQVGDDGVPLRDQTWRLIRAIKQQYSRRIPVVA